MGRDSVTRYVEQSDCIILLNVHLEPTDISPALERLAKRMAETV
jgi:hypothetical protein